MTSQTSSSSFKLNPSACEFVPSFAMNSSVQNNSPNSYNNNNYQNNKNYNSNRYQNNQPRYNNGNKNYNNNYRNNNRQHNNNNNYYNQNSNRNNNYNQNNYYNNGSMYNSNQVDVDPFEMEARCEAVVEILQDDRVRDHLNPDQDNQTQAQQMHPNQDFSDNLDQCEDEEEMLEMMAMQEECRLEMMKFYIQSQNPKLFETIYHDVSYPDTVKPEDQLEPKVKSMSLNASTNSSETKAEIVNGN